jgi:hypothetical protein
VRSGTGSRHSSPSESEEDGGGVPATGMRKTRTDQPKKPWVQVPLLILMLAWLVLTG